ncbi:uncharacterized protein [Aegilops tauschii subsp. strangulata]|uniref:uncharacterized protein n=1 Tax=Aegilops tauschii subsp. strangulata TaxID=200361 RepID=UPI001ABC36A9|nr:uncharacterized protein LOC109747970 [Aegilops tauschii subsp. strangulata]
MKETFANLCEYQVKLNPEKSVFGVPAGKLLGFLVSERGIEAKPEKNKLMKKRTLFEWNDQADEAFQDRKRMLSTAPFLAAPAKKEPLLLYIAATSRSLSTVMVVERPEKGKIQAVQRLVYYLSEVLSASKQNYPHHQKMCYSMYFTAKKLKQYFQEHVVTVVSTPPLGEIIGCRDASGQVAKWALELAGHTILYEPRTTIKSQALDDFLVDWTETQYLPPPDSMHWCMHFDGSKMRLGLGAGIVLSSPKGDRLRYAHQIHFTATNNVGEYEALVHGLRLAKELGIRRILCYGDLDLVVQQCSGEWDARDPNMASYRFLVQKLSIFFVGCEFLHVPRAKNEVADTLAKIASSRQSISSGVSLEHLHKPSVKPSPDSESIYVPDNPTAPQPGPGTAEPGPGAAAADLAAVVLDPAADLAAVVLDPAAAVPNPGAADPGSGTAAPEPALVAVFAMVTAPSWALPILEFLENGVLPMDENEAWQVQRRASVYNIINHELVKRSCTGVFQRGVEQDQGIEILLDIHQGECGHHAASRSLVSKAFCHGFYWPTALQDAESLILKCEGCQRFSKRSHQPASTLQTIPISWPFAVWGLDMVGPFKTAQGGMTHLLVAVNKFTKWIEARPIKNLDGPTTVRFVKDIAVRYGMPKSIITDNGTN